jgi:hypothetical protein
MGRKPKTTGPTARDKGAFKIVLVRINIEGWKALKVLAVEQETTLNALAVEAFNDLLKKHGRRQNVGNPLLAPWSALLVEARAEGEEMVVVNTVRMVAALLAAICWFMSARTKLTRVRAGLEELDKVTQLADDLQIMGKWNAAAAGFACVAAVAEILIAFGWCTTTRSAVALRRCVFSKTLQSPDAVAT